MDESQQSKFMAGLRALAEKEAAKNPAFVRLRSLAKSLVEEVRKRFKDGDNTPTVGAYLLKNDEVKIIAPQTQGESAQREIMATLKRLAAAGQITGGACGSVVQRSLVPNGPTAPFVDIHAELIEGLALHSGVPADLPILEKGIPGVKGVELPLYGKRVEPKIFGATPRN